MRFSCIAGAFEQPVAGVQHRSVWLGLYIYKHVKGYGMKRRQLVVFDTLQFYPFV